MELANFKAVCPFEIGDIIINTDTGNKHRITDIACIHYCRSGKVEFQYQLDNMRYVKLPNPPNRGMSLTIKFQ